MCDGAGTRFQVQLPVPISCRAAVSPWPGRLLLLELLLPLHVLGPGVPAGQCPDYCTNCSWCWWFWPALLLRDSDEAACCTSPEL